MFRNAETSTTYLHTSYPIEDDAASNKAKAQYWKYDPSHGLRTLGKAFFPAYRKYSVRLVRLAEWIVFGIFLVAILAPLCLTSPFINQTFFLQTMVFRYQNCSDLLWDKNVLVIKKNFWNLRLKAKNLQNFWDHLNNLFKQWKVRTISGNRILL